MPERRLRFPHRPVLGVERRERVPEVVEAQLLPVPEPGVLDRLPPGPTVVPVRLSAARQEDVQAMGEERNCLAVQSAYHLGKTRPMDETSLSTALR
jgi:hypothetical protein